MRETAFCRETEEAPDSLKKYFRVAKWGYFMKPEGEGCLEKLAAINWNTWWITTPPILLTYIAYKKVSQVGLLTLRYLKWALPIHAAVTSFACVSCYLCKYRKVDDSWNWVAGGAAFGAFPAFMWKHRLIASKIGKGHWMYGIVGGSAWGGVVLGLMKEADPRHWFYYFHRYEERNQLNFQRYDNMGPMDGGGHYFRNIGFLGHATSAFTLPSERISLDFIVGRGNDMPLSFVGERFEHRLLLAKQQHGYLESELDQVPAIEAAIKNRY